MGQAFPQKPQCSGSVRTSPHVEETALLAPALEVEPAPAGPEADAVLDPLPADDAAEVGLPEVPAATDVAPPLVAELAPVEAVVPADEPLPAPEVLPPDDTRPVDVDTPALLPGDTAPELPEVAVPSAQLPSTQIS